MEALSAWKTRSGGWEKRDIDRDDASERRAQRLGDPRHLALGHLREERQRQRALGDVLADRELPAPEAEALPVEGHEMDRGQVGLGLHARAAQGGDDRVAVRAAGQLDDEDEPAAHVAAGVLAGQLEALEAGERLAIQRRDARPAGE